MKNNIFILGLLAVALGFNACKEDDEAKPTTSLEVTIEKDTIIDGVTSSIPAANAVVRFHLSRENWKGSVDPLGLGTRFVTNAQGKARINGLTGGYTYHWGATWGTCHLDSSLANSMTVVGGVNNTPASNGKVIEANVGIIKIVNSSKYPYRLFINGNQWFDIPGSTTISHFKPSGQVYTLRAEQLEGPLPLRVLNNLALTPPNPAALSCNGMKTGTIPWQ
jgi:hypothetical protein